MNDFIKITPSKSIQPPVPDGNENLVAEGEKNYFIDLDTLIRTLPVTSRGLQNIYLQEIFTVDAGSIDKLVPTAIDSLNQAIKNNELIVFLRTKSLPFEERVRKLRESLSSVLKVRHSITPFITTDNNSFYQTSLNEAKLDDTGTNCNAAFEFGLRKEETSSSFIGTMAHELEHRILYANFNFIPTDKDSETIHEFICDLAAFNVLNEASCGDKELFGRYINEYINVVNSSANEPHYVNDSKKCGLAHEAHEAARGTLHYIIEQCKKQNIDLAEVIKQFHSCSLGLIEHYRAGNQLENITYLTFIEGLVERVSGPIKEKGIQINLEEFKGLNRDNVLKFLESYFGIESGTVGENHEESIRRYLQTLIPVSKVRISKI